MNFQALQILLNSITLPPAALKLSMKKGVINIYDPIRKKKVVLTPEELVRQAFTAWLINDLNYPQSLIANEIGINLNNTKKRCDTVIFASNGSPLMIIEFKAPEINISQEVFNQIIRYNSLLRAPYLVVSNGITHYCCKMDYISNHHVFLDSFPSYNQLFIN